MKIKGAEFLIARKLDRELERVISNLFGYSYKVEFVENINEEDAKALEQRREQSKNMAIQRALEHMAIGEQIAEEMANKNNQKKQENKPKKETFDEKNMPPIPPPPDMPPVLEEPEEETPLICGRNPNLRTTS